MERLQGNRGFKKCVDRRAGTSVLSQSASRSDASTSSIPTSVLAEGLGLTSTSSFVSFPTVPTSPAHVKKLDELKRQSRSYKSRTRLDAIVTLGKNSKIAIDPEEFAMISPFFRAAFYGNFIEAETKSIRFDTDKGKEFVQCCALLRRIVGDKSLKTPDIDWLNLQQAVELLDITSYLLIDPLLELLTDLIVSRVTARSLVLLYHKAEYRHIPLAEKLWEKIVRNFDRLVMNNTFLKLTEDEMLKLVHDIHLNINRNDETRAVRHWIKANDCGANTRATQRLREELEGKSDLVGFYEEPRVPNSILLASGGWSSIGPTMLVEAYDHRSERWIRSEISLFDTPRAYHAIVNTGDYLYTIGGFNGVEFYSSTRKFSLSTKECVEIAPMYSKRCYVGCGMLSPERIIAVGGYNSRERLKSAEILHIPTNQWTRTAEMNERRSDGHCAVLHDFVYAVGGFDGMNCHSSVEYYDPQSNNWLMMGHNMTSRRSGVGAVMLAGVIVVCGGFDGTKRLRSCEFIDPREGKWHLLKPMNRRRSNFGIEVLNNEIVVAGGYGGPIGIIDEAETYDFRIDTWTDLPSISLSRSALFLTRIEDHKIIDDFVRPKIVTK